MRFKDEVRYEVCLDERLLSYLCFTGLLCALCQLGEVGGGGPVVLEVAAHQVTSRQGRHQAQLPSQHQPY